MTKSSKKFTLKGGVNDDEFSKKVAAWDRDKKRNSRCLFVFLLIITFPILYFIK